MDNQNNITSDSTFDANVERELKNLKIEEENILNKFDVEQNTETAVQETSQEEIKTVEEKPETNYARAKESEIIPPLNNPYAQRPDFSKYLEKEELPFDPATSHSQNKTSIKTESEMDKKDFLKNLKVDLNQINIVDSNPLQELNNLEFILNSSSKTQIIANQSNYIAYMEGLNYNEMNSLTNSTLDDYASQMLLFQTIHSKINSTSIGKVKFEDWASITSFYDLDSFIFGIYAETFPGDSEFTIECPHCHDRIEAKINNDTLVSGKNEEAYSNIQKLINGQTDRKVLLDNSLVNQRERIILEDSKTILDIKLPTIKKNLEILRSVNQEAKNKTQHILSIMMFLDTVYIIDVEQTKKTGKACYNRINKQKDVARIISAFSYADIKQTSKVINDMINKYAVEYKIKSFTCPKCQERINDIPVDMQQLLFFQLVQI